MSGTTARRWVGLTLGIALVAAGAPAGALTLDWATNPWPAPTTLSQVYTIGGGDVTVTFVDTNSTLVQTPDGSPASPSTSSFLNTPLNAGDDNLFVRADGNSGPAFVLIQFVFTHVGGVSGVSFNLYDIDADLSQWRDGIQLNALDPGGSPVAPTSVSAPTASPSWGYNPVTQRIIGTTPNQGNGDDDGTATVSFAGPIQAFQLTYANLQAPFGNQWIGVSDITFVPEPPLALLVGGFGMLCLVRRARREERAAA